MLNGTVGRLEAVLLFLGLVLYLRMAWLGDARAATPLVAELSPAPAMSWLRIGALVPGGLAVLVFGAKLLVDGAM